MSDEKQTLDLDEIELLEGPELFKYLNAIYPENIFVKRPGFPIREFSVTPIETRNDFNYLLMFWTVSQYREKELKTIRLQDKREDKLDGYAKKLFDSCFKKWR